MEFNENLAEIVGIMLGDGALWLQPDCVNSYKIIVASDKREKAWLTYVKSLFEAYFEEPFNIKEIKCGLHLTNYSAKVAHKLLKAGLIEGNKVENEVTIPSWVLKERKLLIRTVQGLFDTDGCVYKKYDTYAQIEFKFGSEITTKSVHNAVKRLGFNPTKIQRQYNSYTGGFLWRFYFSRQAEIELFFTEVTPKNPKHMERYKRIKGGAAGI